MIYDIITQTLNNYLGDDYILTYAHNYDTNWDKILTEKQEEIKFGVLQTDSGNTTQVSDAVIRTEQLRLVIQIPITTKIFNEAINKIKEMMTDLNGRQCLDTETNTTAVLFFGENQDAGSHIINGQRWWQWNILCSATFYNGFVLANDISVQVYYNSTWYDLTGIITCNYLNDNKMDNVVVNNNTIPIIYPNSTSRNLTITAICLTNDTLIQALMTNEAYGIKYQIKYNNSIITRTFYAYLAQINENATMGDILKLQITFVQTAS